VYHLLNAFAGRHKGTLSMPILHHGYCKLEPIFQASERQHFTVYLLSRYLRELDSLGCLACTPVAMGRVKMVACIRHSRLQPRSRLVVHIELHRCAETWNKVLIRTIQ
jgi:hypothetical protein